MAKSYNEFDFKSFLEKHKGEYETVLWTGKTDGIGSAENSKRICKKHDIALIALKKDGKQWKTIEMLLEEADILIPSIEWKPVETLSTKNVEGLSLSFDVSKNQETNEKWHSASRVIAEEAFGQVYIIMGRNCREKSIYNLTERETLSTNPNINQKIIFINPKTHKYIRAYDKTNLPKLGIDVYKRKK